MSRGTIFRRSASDAEIAGFVRAIGQVAREEGLVAAGLSPARQCRRATAARKCRTSTSTSSAGARWGRCWRAERRGEDAAHREADCPHRFSR